MDKHVSEMGEQGRLCRMHAEERSLSRKVCEQGDEIEDGHGLRSTGYVGVGGHRLSLDTIWRLMSQGAREGCVEHAGQGETNRRI